MRFSTSLFLTAISTMGILANADKSDGKCRILSLRGGGVHGSFEVGVLQSIVDMMPSNDIKYDYVSGVSIGALNAAIFALFEPG